MFWYSFLMTSFLLQDSNSGFSQLWKLWYPLTFHLSFLDEISPLKDEKTVTVSKFLLNIPQVANRFETMRLDLGWCILCCRAGELDFHQYSAYSELFIWVAKHSSILSSLAVFLHAFYVSVKKLTASSSWQVFCSYARCSSVHNQSTQSFWRRQE